VNGPAAALLLALVSGFLLPLQALMNKNLGMVVGGPLRAALISFSIGTGLLALVVALFVRSGPWLAPQGPTLAWWMLGGGAIGALFVYTSAFAVGQIGTVAFAGSVVTAQLIAAVLLDHFGVLQQPLPVSPLRLLGVGLLIAGAWLVITQR
jgi:transporter family-2 protein